MTSSVHVATFNADNFTGSTSGVVFLRCLLDWAGFLHQTQAQPQKQHAERSALLTGVLASSHVSHAVLTSQIASTLIDAYFQEYHCVYPFVHEATFRAQVSDHGALDIEK